jgi:hypothetical protein
VVSRVTTASNLVRPRGTDRGEAGGRCGRHRGGRRQRRAVLDALDEHATADHADALAASGGAIDVAVNAVGVFHVQGTPLGALSLAGCDGGEPHAVID